MRGTIVCGVTDTEDGRGALGLAIELSERLDLRLVLAHVAEGIGAGDGGAGDGGAGDESLTMKGNREGAARMLFRIADEHGVAASAERRHAAGDPASLLGQIAAEEAADLIIVGARSRGRLRRGLESRLADKLETETPVPVVIAPPRARRPGAAVAETVSRR